MKNLNYQDVNDVFINIFVNICLNYLNKINDLLELLEVNKLVLLDFLFYNFLLENVLQD